MNQRSLENLVLGRGCRWRGKLPTPRRAHPLVRQFVQHANDQKTTLTEVSDRSGIRRSTISAWFSRCSPKVDTLEAALNVIGYELCIRKRRDS
jgi:hypothetical protein